MVRAFENREEGREGEDEDVERVGGQRAGGGGGEEATAAAEDQTATMDYRAFRARLVASERVKAASNDTEADPAAAAASDRWMYEVRSLSSKPLCRVVCSFFEWIYMYVSVVNSDAQMHASYSYM